MADYGMSYSSRVFEEDSVNIKNIQGNEAYLETKGMLNIYQV